ncbi:MAG: O-antigen ligase family protein [Patescibacteria group bacterium]|nr:O-antigen ligase family protein [Patescibacteria group bacterium]
MTKLSHWLNQHWLTFTAAFLLVFLPLYPKWPLFDVLPGYNVRVRLEDILLLIINLVFWTQVLLKKIKIKRAPLLKPMLIYLVIGFLSTLSAIFITKTVYPEWIQIAKLYLHFLRRVEYFSLFFIFFFAVKNKRQIKLFLLLLGAAVVGVALYGFGQKYLYWPAYSTMNREFAKGIALYLTEHARVLSTFGGHFDLAAWVMITIIPLIVMGLLHPSRWWRLAALALAGAEYWLLILSASRISWIAYMAGISAAMVLLLKKKPKLWVWPRGLAVILISTVVMMSFGDLSERFGHIFKLQGVKDLVMRPFTNPPKDGLPLAMDLTPEQQLQLVATQTDVPPSSSRGTRTPASAEPGAKPADVYDNTYDQLRAYLATTSGETLNVSYSANALKYGLSVGIRLDTLWPNAIKALQTNPFLGTGYSTLVKEHVWEFTIAESTDNDYLRLLGETGILGFASFLAIFLVAGQKLWQAYLASRDPFDYALFAAALAVTFGLLVNALYIDVFEASKVAYAYWSFLGLAMAGIYAKK